MLAALDGVRAQLGKAIGQRGRDGWEPRPVPGERSLLGPCTGIGDRCGGLIVRFGPNIRITKVPSMVPRGAHYGAILLSARCHWMYQFASTMPQIGHLLAAKSQTETPSVLGFPSLDSVFYLAG